jgi:hypothetical protein
MAQTAHDGEDMSLWYWGQERSRFLRKSSPRHKNQNPHV